MLEPSRPTDGTVRGRLFSVLRYLLFAVMVASMVGVYTATVGPALGRLRLESTSRLLIPLMIISALVALPVYAALCRQRHRSIQVLTLYGGFVLVCLIYGCFMWSSGSDGTPIFIFTALVAGQILGMPLFVILLVLHLVLARLGFYRRAGRGLDGPE